MKIVKMLVSKSKYLIKCPHEMNAEFFVVHNTFNDASARNEVKYMISNNEKVSFHFAIDDKEVVQGIPENRNALHAGDGTNGKGNRKGLSFEICYSKSGGVRFEKAEKNAAQFIAYKLKERGWGIDKVKKHQDFSKKYCPHRTLDMGWQRFLNMINSYLYDIKDIFNNNLYYTLYPDLQKNIGYNEKFLYEHCVKHGLYESRKFSYVFDTVYYYNKYPDLQKNIGYNPYNLLQHFLQSGIGEGRQASPVFCSAYYLNKYKDLQNAFGDNKYLATKHFLEYGIKEGRQGSEEFDALKYKKKYADLSNQFLNNMEYYYLHYIGWGLNEGRKGK